MKSKSFNDVDVTELRKSAVYKTAISRKKYPIEEIKSLCEARGIEFEDGDEKCVVEIIASDEAVDRDGDIVVQAGIDLSNYLKSSPVLWAHDYSIPLFGYSLREEIGKAGSGQLFKALLLLDKLAYPTQFRQMKKGMLRGISIGFRPKEGGLKFPSETERIAMGMGKYGAIITASELYEITICPVGANQNALVTDISKTVDGKKLPHEEKNECIILSKEFEDMKPEDIKALFVEALDEVAVIGAVLKSGDKLQDHHITALTKCSKALGNAQERVKSILHDHGEAGRELTDEHKSHLTKAIRYTDKAGMHAKSVMFDHGEPDEDDADGKKSSAYSALMKAFPEIFTSHIEASADEWANLHKQFSPTKG